MEEALHARHIIFQWCVTVGTGTVPYLGTVLCQKLKSEITVRYRTLPAWAKKSLYSALAVSILLLSMTRLYAMTSWLCGSSRTGEHYYPSKSGFGSAKLIQILIYNNNKIINEDKINKVPYRANTYLNVPLVKWYQMDGTGPTGNEVYGTWE